MNVAVQTGVKMPLRPAPEPQRIRRFELPDLSRHGGWIMKRLQKTYPHMNDRALASWLQGILDRNEYLFLYQDHAVALAEVLRPSTLAPKPVVQERFVFAEEGYAETAAEFYTEFKQWAKSQDIDVIIVEETTDVPHDLIKEKLGRVFERKQLFARVK